MCLHFLNIIPLLIQIGAKPSQSGLDGFLGQLASSFKDPVAFRSFAGPTFFDDVPSSARSQFGKPKIVFQSADGQTAVVLLSAAQHLENSGDETWTSLQWSGLYEVKRAGDSWKLGNRQPISTNHLDRQDIELTVDPATGLAVKDRLSVRVDASSGFQAMLNKNAQISSLTLDGGKIEYEFQNGLLWLGAHKGSHELEIYYTLKVERPAEGGNSAAFSDDAGHVRNQEIWHPILGFGEQSGLASFHVQAKIPAKFQLALDVPQVETVVDGTRVVVGDSTTATTAMSFAYDDAWKPRMLAASGIQLTLFATNDFLPADDVISAAASQMAKVLIKRFGNPNQGQLKIVQMRRRGGSGWFFLSNQGIFAGVIGAKPYRDLNFFLTAHIGHELSHLWTRSTGWARFLLTEGWATYAESLVFADQFGADTERQFWRDQLRRFLLNSEATRMALRDDVQNNGLAYSKGSWLFRMTEKLVGQTAFEKAIRRFVQAPTNKSGYEDFLACFGSDQPAVQRFLTPWTSEVGLPKLQPRRAGHKIILTQTGPIYWLPNLVLRLTLADGTMEYSRIEIKSREAILDLNGKDVVSIEIDPDETYLLDRRLFRL